MGHGTSVFVGLFALMLAVYWFWPQDPRLGVVKVYYAGNADRPNPNPVLPAYRAALNQEGK